VNKQGGFLLVWLAVEADSLHRATSRVQRLFWFCTMQAWRWARNRCSICDVLMLCQKLPSTQQSKPETAQNRFAPFRPFKFYISGSREQWAAIQRLKQISQIELQAQTAWACSSCSRGYDHNSSIECSRHIVHESTLYGVAVLCSKLLLLPQLGEAHQLLIFRCKSLEACQLQLALSFYHCNMD
jgi:hypothetical protein